MAKRTILTDQPRDFIQQERAGEKTIFRNPRTGQQVELDRHSSAHQRRQAIKSLQESIPDLFANVKAAEGMDLMAGAKPAEAADDPEPYIPLSRGRLRDKALTAHAQWAARRDAAAARQRELADIDRLSTAVADKLGMQLKAAEQQEQQAEDYWSWENALRRAETAQPGGSTDAD